MSKGGVDGKFKMVGEKQRFVNLLQIKVQKGTLIVSILWALKES